MWAFKYFGIDWLAMALTFFALWNIGNKNKLGFLIMMCGNLCGVAIGAMSQSIAMILANIVFFSMNARAERSAKPSELALAPKVAASRTTRCCTRVFPPRFALR